KVREAAARAQCQNNLKQVALAIHNYVNTYEQFPTDYWIVDLLPFIEQSNLAQELQTAGFPDYSSLWGTKLPLSNCPSDPRGDFIWTSAPYSAGLTWYVAVAGIDFVDTHSSTIRSGILAYTHIGNTDQGGTISQVTDGLSNTVMIGERPPGPNSYYGFWA